MVHSTDGSHTAMVETHVMGRNAEECTNTCVRRGGKYVLVDTVHRKIYRLADPERAAEFAGQRVRVLGVYGKDGVFSITTIKLR